MLLGIEAWNDHKYRIMHRTVSKELSTPNVYCASIEKCCYREERRKKETLLYWRKKEEKKAVFKFPLPDYQHMFLDLKLGRKNNTGRKLSISFYKMADALQICKSVGEELGGWRQKAR